MSTDSHVEVEPIALACHEMLLRIAGRVPDQALSACRAMLAEQRYEALGETVARLAHAHQFGMSINDFTALHAAGTNPELLRGLTTDEGPPPPFSFAATQPEGWIADPHQQALQEAVVDLVSARAGVIGVWRSWRSVEPGLLRLDEFANIDEPAADGELRVVSDAGVGEVFGADGDLVDFQRVMAGADGAGSASKRVIDETIWRPVRAVFVVETTGDPIALAADLAAAMERAGETDPQVETYRVDTELPPYQRLARGFGELVWAADPEPTFRLAKVFDAVDPVTGPLFGPEHPRLTDTEEVSRIGAYLRAGQPLLVTLSRMDDVVDPQRRGVVPMSFRTDGTWIWADTSLYYLEEYGLEPDPELVAAIRAHDYEFPVVDGVASYRALAYLSEPEPDEPDWVYPERV